MTESIPEIAVAQLKLEWTQPWHGPPAPHLLRGAIAAAFSENDLFHQHGPDGHINRYPRIQYRWADGCGLIYGFGDAVESLGQVFMQDLELRLGERCMTIASSTCSFQKHKIEFLPGLKRYYFRSPWLALNQENYQSFSGMNRRQQDEELDRILVGNMLSALKGFGIHAKQQIYAAVMPKRSIGCIYKDQKLRGFLGTFATNLQLPPGFGLGKAVSHGYGWVEPVSEG